jgi:small-conductance mechanosensitive channel
MKQILKNSMIFVASILPGNVFAQSAQDTADTAEGGIMELLVGLKQSAPNILVALLILVISVILAKTAQKTVTRAFIKTGGHESALKFIGKTAYSVCIVLGITIALKIVGIDIGFIVGAASFGLGFALKDMLENYVAGIIVLMQEPFKVGDVVKVNEYFGRVQEIEARTTSIRVWDGQRVIMPNSIMISNALINYSSFPERRITIAVGVSYDTDLARVLQIINQAFIEHQEILKDPPPLITLTEFGESSINISARFWIDATVSNWLRMTSEGVRMVKEAFDKEGINIPFPIRTLSVNKQDSDDMYEVFGGQK